MLRQVSGLVAALAIVGIAAADTAYVKPSSFTPNLDQTITVEVAFSDYCCEPRYAVRTDTYTIVNPDGTVSKPERIEIFATTTVLEHAIAQQGTTRISTGERLGRKGEYVFLDGAYHLVNSPDAELTEIPAGTPILSSQTATISDAYVTAGSPDWKTVRAPMGRLSIQPMLHPNLIKTGMPFSARVMMDGEPVAGHTIVLTNERQRLDRDGEEIVKTDQNGIFTVMLKEPGIALLMARIQAPAPEGAETDIRSYTTALTLRVEPE